MLLLALLIACDPAPAPPGVEQAGAEQGVSDEVDVAGLARALESGAVLVDVRTPEEFAQGHVDSAVNLPLGSFEPSDLQAYEGAPVYLICQSGGRSARAAKQLSAAGFHTINVKGGTSAWVAAGRPVVK